MRTVLSMALKDLKLICRDWLGLFFIIGFPITIAILFGAMYGWVDRGHVSLAVAVVDEDHSEMSAKFQENLRQAGNIEIQQLPRDEATDRVRRGSIVGMIILPKGFGETAGIPWMESRPIELGTDPSRKAEAAMLQGMIMQSVGKLMAERFQDPGAMRPIVAQAQQELARAEDLPVLLKPLLQEMLGSLDKFMESWQRMDRTESDAEATDAEVANAFQLARIETFDVTRQIPAGSTETLVKKLRSRWDVSFPQAMVWGILACAAGFAISIVRERKQGTFLRLQVAPVTRGQILAGKALACFLAVVSVIFILTLIGTWLGMRPLSPLQLAAAASCIAFCFVGIMTLMSVIGKSEEAVSGAAWMANMIMAMFGGGMIPLMLMPGFMKTLSNFSPIKWSVLALEGSIWRGFTWMELLGPCAVLLAIGSVCLAVGCYALSHTRN